MLLLKYCLVLQIFRNLKQIFWITKKELKILISKKWQIRKKTNPFFREIYLSFSSSKKKMSIIQILDGLRSMKHSKVANTTQLFTLVLWKVQNIKLLEQKEFIIIFQKTNLCNILENMVEETRTKNFMKKIEFWQEIKMAFLQRYIQSQKLQCFSVQEMVL
jgi:hypothetical protein